MTKPRYWNIWWTLMMVSATLTLMVAALEILGILRDLGLMLGIVGGLVTVVFGFTASTRSSLVEFRGEVLPRLDRLVTAAEFRGEIAPRLDRIVTLLDERLPRSTT